MRRQAHRAGRVRAGVRGLALMAALAALLAGCSAAAGPAFSRPEQGPGSASASTPSPAPSVAPTGPALAKAAAAVRYLAIIAPRNAALATMDDALDALGDHPTVADLAAVTRPFALVQDKAGVELSSVAWPAAAATDVRALVLANVALSNDLRAVAGLHESQLLAWVDKTDADLDTSAAIAARVRVDLGLPPSAPVGGTGGSGGTGGTGSGTVTA